MRARLGGLVIITLVFVLSTQVALAEFHIAPLGSTLEEVQNYYGNFSLVIGQFGNVWTRDEWLQSAHEVDVPTRYVFYPSSNGMTIKVSAAFSPDDSESRLHPTMRLSYQLFVPDQRLSLEEAKDYLPDVFELIDVDSGYFWAEGIEDVPTVTYHGEELANSFVYIDESRQYVIGFVLLKSSGGNIFFSGSNTMFEPVSLNHDFLECSIAAVDQAQFKFLESIGALNIENWPFDEHLRQVFAQLVN